MLKCQGCEAVVANGGLRPCDNCGRPVCRECAIEVTRTDLGDLAVPLCQKCWHEVFGIDEDD